MFIRGQHVRVRGILGRCKHQVTKSHCRWQLGSVPTKPGVQLQTSPWFRFTVFTGLVQPSSNDEIKFSSEKKKTDSPDSLWKFVHEQG